MASDDDDEFDKLVENGAGLNDGCYAEVAGTELCTVDVTLEEAGSLPGSGSVHCHNL